METSLDTYSAFSPSGDGPVLLDFQLWPLGVRPQAPHPKRLGCQIFWTSCGPIHCKSSYLSDVHRIDFVISSLQAVAHKHNASEVALDICSVCHERWRVILKVVSTKASDQPAISSINIAELTTLYGTRNSNLGRKRAKPNSNWRIRWPATKPQAAPTQMIDFQPQKP